jgi:hypothetical protein
MRVKFGLTPIGITVLALLLLGAVSLTVSIGYDSSILAFIGLGLIFWGAILLYIKPEQNVSKTLLEATLSPSLTTLNQMIQDLGYKGDTTYLPPKYFANPDTTKIYISKYKNTSLPTPELIQPYENQPVTRTTQGLLITPPGIQLSKLMEKSLGTTFIKTDLKDLEQKLPKIVIEDLEIAENIEIQEENNPTNGKEDPAVSSTETKNILINTKITKPIYKDVFKDDDSSQIAGTIGSPVCSAIAVALTRATGKPVRITNTSNSEDDNTVEVTYMIIEG